MDRDDLEKTRIREKYKGTSPEKLRVIPAIEEVNFFTDTSPKSVAVYVRVSTNDPRQTSSFELQQNHYADVIGDHPGWELYQIYADEGISGTSLKKRNAFLRMMEDCEAGKVDLIVTKSVSRFSRNIVDCITCVRRLAALKRPVGVFFESEYIYTLDNEGELRLSTLVTLAQHESEAKSKSMNLSYEMRFRRGILLTPELLGYDLDEKGQLVVNPEEARTVKLIFFMYLYGYTCQQIADSLMELKRLTKRGSPKWSAGSVLNILRNERHCGYVLARKTWTPNYLNHKSRKNRGERNQYEWAEQHEPIISRDDFLAVQRLISNAKHRYRGILPSLRVIDSGALAGFVSINPRWAGFQKQDYYNAVADVMGQVRDIPKACCTHMAQEGELDLRGYEIARGQFFSPGKSISVTFSAKEVVFSAVGLEKLDNIPLVELLFDPVHQNFAVRPAAKTCRNGVAWLRHDGQKFHPKPIPGLPFLGTIFEILQWNTCYKYRVRGVYRKQENEAILLFDLHDTEVILPKGMNRERKEERTKPASETVSPMIANAGKSVVAYPAQWCDDFGSEYYRHAQAQELMAIDLEGKWEVRQPGVFSAHPGGFHPSTPEQLRQGIQELFTTMEEEGGERDGPDSPD